MKAKRILSLLAACLMVVSSLLLASCNSSEENTSSNVVGDVKGDTLEDLVTMPEFRWKDNEEFAQFDVLVYSNETQNTYYSEDVEPGLYTTTDQALTDAVQKRNDEILNKYGVTIKAVAKSDVAAELRTTGMSGDNLYDAAMPFMSAAANLAQENLLYDLYEFEDYLHFDQSWWDQSATKSLSIGDKLFFTTGEITIMPKIVSFAMTFNKKMISTYFGEEFDLYQLVKDGKWTFDKLMEMSRTVTAETDGVAGMTWEDTWGLSSSYNDAVAFYVASGNSYIGKDADNLPIVTFGDSASITITQKILQNLQVPDEWIFHCDNAGTANIWQTSLDVFGQNRALFRTSAFSAIKKLRGYDDVEDFGIVPMPKMSETQDTYYTYCNANYAYCVVIPSSLSREQAEYSAYILEAMAFGGEKYITPAYYETTLKSRDLRDAESEEMLDDYVFSNIVYDLGVIYNFGGITSIIGSLMQEGKTDVVSKFDEIDEKVNDAIEECLEYYGV